MSESYKNSYTVRKPVGFLEWVTCKLIRMTIRKSVAPANHAPTTQVLMKSMRDELQSCFREDNEPTTVYFIVKQLVRASDLNENDIMYKKLMG